jgi:hypothetical protein
LDLSLYYGTYLTFLSIAFYLFICFCREREREREREM